MQNKHTCFLLAAATLAFSAASPADAQVARTWVSGLGDDASANCARTAPCKTFSGAISKTIAGGEINCLDSAGYGQLSINKSLTVDCAGVNAGVLAQSGNGFTINTDAASGMIVRIRNLNFSGTLTGTTGIQILGTGSLDNAISIENVVIDGFTTFGIQNSAKIGRVLIKDTVVRNNFGTAIGIAPPAGMTSTIKATLQNVSAFDSNYGFAFGNGVQAVVKGSIASGNTTAGVEADPGATVAVASSVIVGNATGIVASAGSTIRVRDSDVVANTAGLSGTVQSHANNAFMNNGAGGSLVPVTGGVTNPQGLQ